MGTRHLGRQGDIGANRQKLRHAGRQEEMLTGRHAGRETDRQAGRQRGTEADRQKGRQANLDGRKCIYSVLAVRVRR